MSNGEILSEVKEVRSYVYDVKKRLDSMESQLREIREFAKKASEDASYMKGKM